MTITINGIEQTSDMSVATIGARIRVRVFANRLHMRSGYESGIESIGEIVAVESDDGFIDIVIKCDDGRVKTLSFSADGSDDDRIIQAA